MEGLKNRMIQHLVSEGKNATEVKKELDKCNTQIELRNKFIELNK